MHQYCFHRTENSEYIGIVMSLDPFLPIRSILDRMALPENTHGHILVDTIAKHRDGKWRFAEADVEANGKVVLRHNGCVLPSAEIRKEADRIWEEMRNSTAM